MSTTDFPWKSFLDMVEYAKKTLEGTAPVALVCLPTKKNPDGSFSLFYDDKFYIIWPADVPIEDRGTLLRHMAKSYENNEVTR